MIENLMAVVSDKFLVFGFLLVSCGIFIICWRKKKTRVAVKYGSCEDLKPAGKRARKINYLIIVLFLLSVVGSAFVATGNNPDSSSSDNCKFSEPNRRDTVIIQDISGSMSITTEEKFALNKSVTLRILGSNPNENIGLVFFSTIAFAPIAPTSCHAVFNSFTDEDFYETFLLKSLSAGTDGSAGLMAAQSLLELSDAKYKRIIFVGDLEDNDMKIFINTLQSIAKNGIQIQLIGIKTAEYYYGNLKMYGFDILRINSKEEAERIGPLPEDLAKKESFYFSSRLNDAQILVGWTVLIVLIFAFIVNFYYRRPFEIGRKR